MKKLIHTIMLYSCVLALGLVTGCDNSSPQPTPPAAATPHSNESTSTPQKASKPEGSWPYMQNDTGSDFAIDDMIDQNFVVVFDGSGSMGSKGCSGKLTKMDAAKKALAEFALAVPDSANLGLIVFDGNGLSERVALTKGNKQRFIDNVMRVAPTGGTPLGSSIQLAYRTLTAQGRSQLGYGDYNLVVVTDGEASDGESPTGIVSKILRNSPVVIHTIGFCIDKRHSLNQPGKTVYRSANDLESLRLGLKEVLAEAPEFTASDFN